MATRTNNRQVVMAFDERSDLRSARHRGGKGASLADMRALGLPVPPGFTISTSVARAVMQHGVFPKRFEWQLLRGIALLEKQTGKTFGGETAPLLVSVRSGAEVSMPGMMDTILNLGINEYVADSLEQSMGIDFTRDCWNRFGVMYRQATGDDTAPNDPMEQLYGAIRAVLGSWDSERAIAYRRASGIKGNLGTAVTVQAMVFGNRSGTSGTGVVFSRNPSSGERGMYGEFLANAQGEDVVSGSHTPMPIEHLRIWNKSLFEELEGYVQKLEQHLDSVADVEFTIEDGKLWLLQCRSAKLSAEAAATFAVHQVWDKNWCKKKASETLTGEQLATLDTVATFTDADVQVALELGRGIAAAPGASVGSIAFSSEDAIAMKAEGRQVVLVRPETTPDDLPGMLAAAAIVTLSGGATSHAAVVARQLAIPAVVGVDGTTLPHSTTQGDVISVCGNTGRVFLGELPVTGKELKKEVNIFLKWVKQYSFPTPRINFEAVKEQCCVNRMLADVYLVDAMALAAQGSTIAHDVEAEKRTILVSSAEFFVCYLAIAVASEVRHHERSNASSATPNAIKKLVTEFKIHEEYQRSSEGILTVLAGMSLVQQTEFFRLAAVVFGEAQWPVSYGGPKWAAIAQAGADFLSGRLTHGVFVDHVFDLRHNGGVLFNKHTMVSSNTDEDVLHAQLNFKRAEHPIGELYDYFDQTLDGHVYTRHIRLQRLSPSVFALWKKGVSLNLWKEEKNEPKAYRPKPPFYDNE